MVWTRSCEIGNTDPPLRAKTRPGGGERSRAMGNSGYPWPGIRMERGACVGADLRIGPRKPCPGGRCSVAAGLESTRNRTDSVRAVKIADSDPRALYRMPLARLAPDQGEDCGRRLWPGNSDTTVSKRGDAGARHYGHRKPYARAVRAPSPSLTAPHTAFAALSSRHTFADHV
jgi:hypothetical protein